MFNPRYMSGVGLTPGDCIEHIWSELRKFNNRCAYMGDAARQDLLSLLVRPGKCLVVFMGHVGSHVW